MLESEMALEEEILNNPEGLAAPGVPGEASYEYIYIYI